MTQGVFLTCFGKRGYGFAAYNMAFSIKTFNPKIQICLFHDDSSIQELPSKCLEYFDKFIKIPDELKWVDGRIDPANVKINIYDYLPYDYNLYLDVDGLALKNIQPIFDQLIEKGNHYYTHIFDYHTIDKGNDIPSMVWAWAEEIWYHFKLPQDAKLPGTNSSIQFIKKCEESKHLFNTIRRNYANPIPLDHLRLKWGGGQPDELYLNVSLAQCGWKECTEYVFFGNGVSSLNFSQIEENFYILSLFGGKGFTKGLYWEWYDRMLFSLHEQIGMEHRYKGLYLQKDKHANQTNATHNKPAIDYPLHKALIPIRDTKKINTENCIKNYRATTGKFLEVTNYFNPSWIEFKGMNIMCYRMEPMPFCTTTRLGLCLIDDNLNPIEGTHVLLNLHSRLKGYMEGFHVEDPRLFIHNNELYLSYTDGYQMAQAKIEPNTLQAANSFYIEKPNTTRTEKNWIFFSHENELYSVYSTSPHVIFKMDEKKHSIVYQTDWKNQWKYGEIRGGSSPILWNGQYLSFFHSSITLGYHGRQYHMGAYTFESKPPFNVRCITREPIISGENINPSIQRLSNKIFVVFPGGQIRNETGFDVAFGYNDYECRSVNISDEFLKNNLIEV